MSLKSELIQKETLALYDEGAKLGQEFQRHEAKQFAYDYQKWYTKALSVVAVLAPDRLPEFRAYYEIDPKRKALRLETFVIQDYLKGVAPAQPGFDSHATVLHCFFNQLTILRAVLERIGSVLSDIEGELYASLQDSEINIARKLAKVSVRAAGALVGVVIEGHLQKVATARGVKIAKKDPTISDLNDPLKSSGVIDTPTWRKISFLADIRNLCSHQKSVEPTKEQVGDLIQGAEWLVKNVH